MNKFLRVTRETGEKGAMGRKDTVRGPKFEVSGTSNQEF
jgi:hypothetical protein